MGCLDVDDSKWVLTIKVATFAILGPHVSAMISKVNAFVAVSIPLFTKMNNGRRFSSIFGFNAVRVALHKFSCF